MSTFLITYDLRDPDYEKDLLKFLENAQMVAESSYVITTDWTAQQLVDGVKRATKEKVTVYVFPIGKGGGFGPKSVNDWLLKKGLV